MISCVLMCGGKGSRLNTDPTVKVEKPLLELKNRSLIEHMIDAINIQIKNLETKRQFISYTYDAITMKWVLCEVS